MAYTEKVYVSPAKRQAAKEESGKPCHSLDKQERRKRAKQLRLDRSLIKNVEELNHVFCSSQE